MPLLSTFSFLIYLLTVLMSLSFYGKIVLKVLKCEDRVSLGDPVCLIAGLCLVIAAALPLQNHVSNYPLLFVMYYAGLLGFILGFALLRVKELLKKKLTLEEVEKLLKNRDSLCAAMVFGLFFSFFYSMAFKYGKLSIPLGGPTDYHIWGANVDVFLGHVSDKAMELSGRFYLSRDYEIGTLITLGFLSVAKGMTGLEALPSISILMYSLLGAGIFKLVKRVTGSSFWMGILISFGVLSGYLFNVVLLMGSYAQFIGTISYLAAVFGLFNCVNTEKSFREKLIPIVFPFLLLSICYTGVLIVFYSFFYLIGFIYALFLVREGLNTIVYRIKEVSKLMFPAVVAGILPFFVFLWIPYLMIQRFMALKGHIVEGLTLPNFNTFVFSGFPGFSLPLVFTDFKMSVFTFTVLIAVTLALFRLSWKTSDNAKRPLELYSLTFAFLIFVVFYIYQVHRNGNAYQIWKFSTYSLLPLSFVTTALLYKVLTTRLSLTIKQFSAVFLVLFIIFCFTAGRYAYPVKVFTMRIYHIESADDSLNLLKRIKSDLYGKKKIAIHISNMNNFIMALDVFGQTAEDKIFVLKAIRNDKRKKEYLGRTHYPRIKSYLDYDKVLDDIDYVISDKSFDGLFNGDLKADSVTGYVVYDKSKFEEIGYVSVKGMVPNARDVFGRYFTVKIKLPSDIVGKQSTFVLGYSTDDGPGTVCEVDEASVTVRSGYNSFNETVKADNGFFKLAIPDEFTVNGFLTVEFVLPPNYGNLDGPCSFLINEVKI